MTSREQRVKEWRRRSAGSAVVGSALLGAGSGVNMAADKMLERKNMQKPLRAALKGQLKPHHAAYLGTRASGRALQLAGFPLAAAGIYGVVKPKKVEALSMKRHVVKPIKRAITFEDQAIKGRKLLNDRLIKKPEVSKSVATGMTPSEHEMQAKRKERAKRLSHVSGTLGLTALGLRAPSAAKVVARRIPKIAPKLSRIAGKEEQATKLSNTLGIGAIGVGSAGSFNFARIQGTEAKAEKRGLSKSDDKKKKLAAGAAIGGAALLTPVPVKIPNAGNKTYQRIESQAKSGSVHPNDLRRVATGPGSRFGDSIHTAKIAMNLKNKGFDKNRPIELTRYKRGELVVTGGHHRLEAAQRLGLEKVPTKITDKSARSARAWMPAVSAINYRRNVAAGRLKDSPRQSLSQISTEASKKIPAWQRKANSIKSVAEDVARSKGGKITAGVAVAGLGLAGAKKAKDHMSKSDPIIWVASPEQQAAALAKNPNARVMIREKKKSAESKNQRKARQAAQPKKVEIHKPAPVEARPSFLHRVSGKKFPGGRLGAGAALVGSGALIGAAAGRVNKSETKEKAKRAAQVAGGSYIGYMGAGLGLSHMAQRARSKDKASQKLMFEHRKKMGIPATGSMRSAANAKQIAEFNRTMPAGVKYSGLTRVLARTHGVSQTGRMAIPVALAGAAGSVAYDHVKKGFLETHGNRISPKAEQGYKYLRRGRNESAVIAGLSGGLGGLSAVNAGKAIAAKRYGSAALSGAVTGVNAYTGVKSAKKAKRWNDKMDKIKAKAYEREKAGIYGVGRDVEMAKALWSIRKPGFGRPFPKGLTRAPSMRSGSVRRTASGKMVSFRGSFG